MKSHRRARAGRRAGADRWLIGNLFNSRGLTAGRGPPLWRCDGLQTAPRARALWALSRSDSPALTLHRCRIKTKLQSRRVACTGQLLTRMYTTTHETAALDLLRMG
ncbi:hypothetical protein EVAR_45516_1, partial [Eumeta japonica]